MGNKSQNDYFYEENDIDKIKLNYLNYKLEKPNSDYKYIDLSCRLHSIFLSRYELLFRDRNLKEIKEKLISFDKEEKAKEINKLKEIINEGETLYDKVFDDFRYYKDFFYNYKGNYENGNISGEAYNKICQEVIVSILNTLIKSEKELIILKDKIRQLKIFA